MVCEFRSILKYFQPMHVHTCDLIWMSHLYLNVVRKKTMFLNWCSWIEKLMWKMGIIGHNITFDSTKGKIISFYISQWWMTWAGIWVWLESESAFQVDVAVGVAEIRSTPQPWFQHIINYKLTFLLHIFCILKNIIPLSIVTLSIVSK